MALKDILKRAFLPVALAVTGAFASPAYAVEMGPDGCLPPAKLMAQLKAEGQGSGTITATNATGCITLVFYTDGIVSGSGWAAQVTCGPPPPPPPPPVNQCNIFVYETPPPAGATGNYGNNVSSTQTFCANAGQLLTVTFDQFQVENQWDKLYVFDGPTTASPMIPSGNGPGQGPAPFGAGGYWGNALPGPFTSSSVGPSPNGCLTFHFVTDPSVTFPGFRARTRDILVELGRRKMIGGQEDMIEDTAMTMAKERGLLKDVTA